MASFFSNAFHVGFTIDQARWPRTAAFVERVLGQPVFEKLRRFEDIQLGTSIAGRRQALIDAGANICADTLGERVRARESCGSRPVSPRSNVRFES